MWRVWLLTITLTLAAFAWRYLMRQDRADAVWHALVLWVSLMLAGSFLAVVHNTLRAAPEESRAQPARQVPRQRFAWRLTLAAFVSVAVAALTDRATSGDAVLAQFAPRLPTAAPAPSRGEHTPPADDAWESAKLDFEGRSLVGAIRPARISAQGQPEEGATGPRRPAPRTVGRG